MCIRDSYSITSGGLTPIIYIWDDNISTNELKNVVIVANFDVTDQSIIPYFPYTGNWYDLMDENGETIINVSSTNDQVTLQPGHDLNPNKNRVSKSEVSP